MSRLVQELPQIISWIWALNTGACLGGKCSAKTMRRCMFSPVNNIIPHILRLSAVQQLEKKVPSQASISCKDVSRSRICHKVGFTENFFSAMDFKLVFWLLSCFHLWLLVTVCIFMVGWQVGNLQNWRKITVTNKSELVAFRTSQSFLFLNLL